ncbi:MAG: OmpA family protein [Prevotellaceae bacterium]|nr:OmpA family protein [Prevotellaceae bacterium]
MKRKLLALFVASTLVGNVFAQEEQVEAAAVEESATEGLNHWSANIKAGVDYFRWTDKKINFEGGASVEYTFNPLWGLGVEYMYQMNNHDANGLKPEFDGTVHDATLFASVNLSNILAKYRSSAWQKLNVYANGGVGASIYSWDIKNGADKNDALPLGVVTGVIEYNLSNSFAIGLEGRVKGNNKKSFVPQIANETCGARANFGANLSFRYKFGAENNVRNIALVDYEPKVEMPDVTPMLDEAKKQCEETTSRLEDQIANQNAAIKKLQGQLKETQDSLNKHIQDTKEPVKYTPTKEEDEIIKTAFSQLEFESAKAIIKPSSYSSLDGLAMLLKQHNEWSVILKGYTDNTGNAAKNLQLSKDRAAAVKAYLVNKGVPAAHIQSFGYGSANPIASNSTLAGRAKNRRVEIELFSK